MRAKKKKFTNTFFEHVSEISKKLNFNKIENLALDISKIKKRKGRIFFLGVGGSAGNCGHAVNDFRKLCNIECYSPTDNVSELTARINDEGWEHSFVDWLKVSNLNKKDALFIFSVGGGNKKFNVSTNLIKSIDYSKKIGSKIFGIVGKQDGYLYKKGNCVILIPLIDKKFVTPYSEAFQAVIWHCLVSHPLLKKNKTKW
tara:strand:- start:3503 stop:4102 length:600 start_codon:yes stop_codon:yes gene_type:complete